MSMKKPVIDAILAARSALVSCVWKDGELTISPDRVSKAIAALSDPEVNEALSYQRKPDARFGQRRDAK